MQMRRYLVAASVAALLAIPAQSQVIIGGGTGSGSGTGNVVGPASATDGAVALYDGTTGKLLKDGLAPVTTIAGSNVNLGGSITTTTILDSIGSTQGDILYRSASGWNVLAPGTDGFRLTTHGAGADPTWASATSGGTVTSIAQGNGILLSTAPCTTTCTISTATTTNAQTGTTYATQTTDGGKVVSLSNASPVAVSLSQANTTGFTAGFGLDYDNIGAGAVTITATTSTFDNGATTLGLVKGQDAYIWSDSTNYHSALSLPVMAQDTILGNPNASNYPTAMSVPSCANDGAHALVYASHALACASVSGGGAVKVQNIITGNWYSASQAGATAASSSAAQNTVYWMLYIPTVSYTTDQVGIYISTLSAGGNADIAIYSDSSDAPNAKLANCAANISTAATGALACTLSSNVSFTAGTPYWIGLNGDNATFRYTAVGGSSDITQGFVGGAATQGELAAGNTTVTRYTNTGVTFGTWPSTPTISYLTGNARQPYFQIHVTSVP